jgi:phage uncharacterized protein, XkdX family
MSFWQMAYRYGWASKDQLKQAVGYSLITAAEYQQITGEAYAE